MSLRSILGFNRRPWNPRNAASSSLSAAALLLLPYPCRGFASQSSAVAAEPPGSISMAFLVDSCGLSPDSAAAASASIKKLSANRKTSRNPEAVLELFRSRGFSSTQISRIVALQPKLLVSNSERTLKPKIDYLRAEGFSQNDITEFVASLTVLFFMSLEKMIKPNFDILRTIFPSNAIIVAAVTRSNWLLSRNLKKTMLPNSETLRAIGVPEERIFYLINLDARVLTQAPRRFDEYVQMLKGIGLSHTSFNYIIALRALSRLSRATLQKKISFFRNVGFTEEDFFSAFRGAPNISCLSEPKIKKTVDLFKGFGLRDDEIPSFFGKKAPNLLALSEQNIAKRMDFLVRTLNCKPRDVLSRPALLWYSFERRLIPRAFVHTALLSKGLHGRGSLHSIFFIREEIFLKNYVMKFQNELPHLLEEYEKLKLKDCRSSVSAETSA